MQFQICTSNHLKHCVCLCTMQLDTVSSLSYSTIVLYSRDNEGVGVVHEEKSTQNHLQKSSMAFSQYWSGINKPKRVFRMTRNVSDEVLRNLKKKYFSEFSAASLPASLMRSVKCSGKLATATALLLWRKRFEFCGEKTFHNIKYL